MKDNFWDRTHRLAGLRRFAVAITVLNILGHFLLGFEQSWATPLVALASAYTMEILLELVDARLNRRPSRFSGGLRSRVDFLLSAHISGLACGMLLYANNQLWPVAFAAAAAIGSKAVLRVKMEGGPRHVFNPSNFGIMITLLLFPWIGVAQPYQFTENLYGAADWVFPAVVIALGTFLNARFTKRLPLIAAWLGAYFLQGLIRGLFFDAHMIPIWSSMTGLAFLLFTFYMVTDPATTPNRTRSQIVFGAGVGLTYGVLVTVHVVFGLFFALSIICALRGVVVVAAYNRSRAVKRAEKKVEAVEPEPKIEAVEPMLQNGVLLVREEA